MDSFSVESSNERPLISVVMSVFNGNRFLRDAIESILSQTFKNFEFIIIDDGSTDSSREIVEDYAKRDKRIQIILNYRNRGLAWSLNRGISYARGDFIARQDADDISLPDRLASQIEAFQKKPELDLVAIAFRNIDESGKIMHQGPGFFNDQYRLWRLQFHNVYIHSSVMFRKNGKLIYYYDEGLETAQDYELWCRIVKYNNTKYLEVPLIYYRISNGQISMSRKEEQDYSAQTTSLNNLRLCNSCLNQFTSQNLCRIYLSGHISLKDIKFIPALLGTLAGFFQKYEIPIQDRGTLTLLVIKDIFYWSRRSFFWADRR